MDAHLARSRIKPDEVPFDEKHPEQAPGDIEPQIISHPLANNVRKERDHCIQPHGKEKVDDTSAKEYIPLKLRRSHRGNAQKDVLNDLVHVLAGARMWLLDLIMNEKEREMKQFYRAWICLFVAGIALAACENPADPQPVAEVRKALPLNSGGDDMTKTKQEENMYVIDMSTLKKEGEFGSKGWGEACAAASVKILEAANLPAGTEWAFTEHYTHPPARLMEGGREKSGYYMIVKDGKISGGDGVPDEALAIPGFHISARWAAICNQSGALYGSGDKRRGEGEKAMREAIEKYVGRPNPYSEPKGPKIIWPPEIGGPLMAGSDEGNGLHNIAATMQTQSPEFVDYPVTEMRVPIFEDMTEEQKKDFIKLLHIEM